MADTSSDLVVNEEQDDRSSSSVKLDGDDSNRDSKRHIREDAQTEHVVWIGRAPPALCVDEEPVRALFSSFGELRSIKVRCACHPCYMLY